MGVRFDDEEASAFVDRKADRREDVRLGREERQLQLSIVDRGYPDFGAFRRGQPEKAERSDCDTETAAS